MKNSDIWQVHIAEKDVETEPIASLTVEPPEEEGAVTERDRRELILTRGETPEPGGGWDNPIPFAIAENKDGTHQQIVIPTEEVAIGYYLHGIEMHDTEFSEQSVLDTMEDLIDMYPYYEWIENLTVSDRQVRLLDLTEYRSEDSDDFVAGKYLDVGTWRSKGLTDSQVRMAKGIANSIEIAPRECYKTAGRAAELHLNNDRVKYVEGVVLPKHGSQAIKHAWIEIDGKVVELTWPWHRYDGPGAVYFGTEIPTQEILQKKERWNGYSAFILNEEESTEFIERTRRKYNEE